MWVKHSSSSFSGAGGGSAEDFLADMDQLQLSDQTLLLGLDFRGHLDVLQEPFKGCLNYQKIKQRYTHTKKGLCACPESKTIYCPKPQEILHALLVGMEISNSGYSVILCSVPILKDHPQSHHHHQLGGRKAGSSAHCRAEGILKVCVVFSMFKSFQRDHYGGAR